MTQAMERPVTAESGNHYAGWADDYDNTDSYYVEDKNTPLEWDIKDGITPSEEIDTVPISNEFNTEPMAVKELKRMPTGREDMEAVEAATSLEEALMAYDERYSAEAAYKGEQSPQFGADMLLRIADKFAGQMTPEQSHAVALETIAMGHAIGKMANMPPGTTKDRTSLRGLYEMPKIITIAQQHAPEEIPALEKDLRDIAEKIESRISTPDNHIVTPISGPIMIALAEFDKLPEDQKKPRFEDIHEVIEHKHLTESNILLEQREKERKTAERAKKALELSTQASSPAELTGTRLNVAEGPQTAAASLDELEDEDDSSEIKIAA